MVTCNRPLSRTAAVPVATTVTAGALGSLSQVCRAPQRDPVAGQQVGAERHPLGRRVGIDVLGCLAFVAEEGERLGDELLELGFDLGMGPLDLVVDPADRRPGQDVVELTEQHLTPEPIQGLRRIVA